MQKGDQDLVSAWGFLLIPSIHFRRLDILLSLKSNILVLICSCFSSEISFFFLHITQLQDVFLSIFNTQPLCVCRSVDSPYACTYAEIRTRIPDTISWDYNFETTGNVPPRFTLKVFGNFVFFIWIQNSNTRRIQSALLKEAIDDLEWPGSSVEIILKPDPPSVTFRSEGHGDLEVSGSYYEFVCKLNLACY